MASARKEVSLSTAAADEKIKCYCKDFLNLHFNTDIKSLKKAKDLHDKLLEERSTLENQLSLASCEVPSQIENAVQRAETADGDVKALGIKHEQLHHEVMDFLHSVEAGIEQTRVIADKVTELDRYRRYLAHLTHIDSVCSEIKTCLLTDATQQAVDVFQSLTDLFTELHKSSAINLLKYLSDTINFWYDILLERVARTRTPREFSATLESVRWPVIATVIKPPSPTTPAILHQTLSTVFVQLLQLQLPEGLQPNNEREKNSKVTRALINDRGGTILPLEHMVMPLCKRFKYHFSGNKPTNNIDKPEWYMTQVVTWMRDHNEFLDAHIQPLLDANYTQTVDVKVEFTRCLMRLVIDKMTCDLPDLLRNDAAFAHLIDEALLFDLDLRSNHGYPTHLPGVLHVLCLPDAFDKWKTLEKKFAVEKIDNLLTSTNAWTSQYQDVTGVDNLQVPHCADMLISLLHTITERYRPLPDSQCRLDFLDLQLDLLDDFRIRLVQIMKSEIHAPLGQCYTSILNAVHYVSEVLAEWNERLFFTQLQYERTVQNQLQDQSCTTAAEDMSLTHDISVGAASFVSNVTNYLSFSDNSPTKGDALLPEIEGAVFDDVIGLLHRMRTDMVHTIVQCVFTDVKARSRPYRKDRWISLVKDQPSLALSPTAYEMLLVLRDHLQIVQGLLSPPLFEQFWQTLAKDLDSYIFNEVVLCNKFNEGGAAQLQFDITRNLVPLFAPFTDKPDAYFRLMCEACHVLTLNVGSAILLKDVLYDCLHNSAGPRDATPALHELSIYTLTGEQTEMLLSLRINLCL